MSMLIRSGTIAVLVFCGWFQPSAGVQAQDDVADVPARDVRIGDDANKRYFLIGRTDPDELPKSGFRLLVVLPGGDGGADFHPFVKRIYRYALAGNGASEKWLAAQVVSVKWHERQRIVWPTRQSRVPRMKFTTEQFVRQVIDDVRSQYKIDDACVLTLSWSSSGPAAYAISLEEETPVTGSFIAMSVFKPGDYDLSHARGRAYYLLHSPMDRVCPYRMAKSARDTLQKNGANVELVDYAGGHGWKGNLYESIALGVTWLADNGPQPTRTNPAN